MEITIEEIQNKFEHLPENLKWAIMAVNVDEKITEIGKAHGLNIEQLGQISLDTHMVMLGFTKPEKFEETLKKNLGLTEEKNKEIVIEINNKILKEIKEKLMSINKEAEPIDSEPVVSIQAGYREEIPKINVELDATEIKTPFVENKIDVKIEIKKENAPVDIYKEKITELSEEDKLKEIENKKIMESISAQKLMGSYQAPVVKTEYSLNNISKEKEKTGTSINQNVKIPLAATIKPASVDSANLSPSYSIKEDPYRMKPE